MWLYHAFLFLTFWNNRLKILKIIVNNSKWQNIGYSIMLKIIMSMHKNIFESVLTKDIKPLYHHVNSIIVSNVMWTLPWSWKYQMQKTKISRRNSIVIHGVTLETCDWTVT